MTSLRPASMSAEDRAATERLLTQLRECASRWSFDARLARMLTAQCNRVQKFVDEGEVERARGALLAIQEGIAAGGPTLWTGQEEHNRQEGTTT